MSKAKKKPRFTRYVNPGMRGAIYATKPATGPEDKGRWSIQRLSPDTLQWTETGPATWPTQREAQGVLDRIAQENSWPISLD